MLRHLRVTNFAILSDVGIELGPGFNALTGETGAGKSLIVEAVNLLRGGRASADIPRKGTEQAVVEAIFDDLSDEAEAILHEAGLPSGDGELLVRRVIQREGRSRTYVNGALTTAARLADIGVFLVDLSGQHQHQGLVDPRRHRDIIDAFMDEPSLLATMNERFSELKQIRDELRGLCDDESARQQRADFLRFQLEEIDALDLEPGEDETLAKDRDRLASIDRLESGVRSAERVLYSDDGSAIDRLAEARKELERLAAIDSDLAGALEQLVEASSLTADAAASLRSYADSLEGDQGRLAEVEDRLAQLKRVLRKHGGSVAEVVDKANALRTELDKLDNSDESVAKLRVLETSALAKATEVADKLHRSRKRTASVLGEEVGKALAELGMDGAQLSVSIKDTQLSATGTDHVEFLLAANRGEDPKPLAKVASGGELSRIMLAMKLVLRRADNVGTYVFDEVDSGIGGMTADAVARQIASVAKSTQVLCVTHLPQIAARADQHFQVSKGEIDGRTETHVVALSKSERRQEIARMLGGKKGSKVARAHADELLGNARR